MKRIIRLTESELRQFIKECILIESDFSERWGDTYDAHENDNNVDPELRDIMIDMHTLGSYYDEIWDAAHNDRESKYFSDCSTRELKHAAHLLAPIHDIMMNRTDIMDDQQKMSKEDIEDYCGDSLSKLADMQRLGVISRTAARLLDKLDYED